jgi:acyl-CoA thioesterase I
MTRKIFSDLMKRFFPIGMAFLLLFASSSFAQPAEQRGTETKTEILDGVIVALGDSLTAGLGVKEKDSYPTLLQQRLEAEGLHYRVINSGVSGETSSGTLSRLNWILSSLKPDIVILETGANDGLRGLDTGLTRQNIKRIVATLQEKKIVTILAGMQMVGNLGFTYTDRFRLLYQEVAMETGIIFVPFFLKSVAAEAALNNDDGIHPNRRGYEIIVGNLFPYVVQAIKQHKEER